MFFCDSLWILNLAPYVIALVLSALVGLIAFFAWRELQQRRGRGSGVDSTWLLLGLLLLSAVVIVFFTFYAALSLGGTCSLQGSVIWYTG